MERLEGEGRVADPGVAVVPVALAARRLRQRRRQRGNRRPGRHVGQALDRQGGALDRVAQLMVRDSRGAQPVAPEARGRLQPEARFVVALRRGQVLGPGEGAKRPVARLKHVTCPDPLSLDPEREVGLETKLLPGAARVGGVPAAVHCNPLRGNPAVVEDRLADQLDLDVSVETFHGPDQHVIGVVVGRRSRVRRDRVLVVPRPHRQGFADEDPARGRLPGRHEHVRAGLVGPCGRVRDPERAEPEEACLPVEEAAEHARRVERGNAEPVDRAVGGDQRSRVTVGEERVIGDRRKRRRRCRALRLRLGGVGGRRGGHRAPLRSLIHGSRQRPWPATSSSAAAGPHEPGS